MLGFSFANDLTTFKKGLKEMEFYNKISDLVDVQKEFIWFNPDSSKTGLKDVVSAVLDSTLSKVEKKSNWEVRPLR